MMTTLPKPHIILVNRCILLNEEGNILLIKRASDDRHYANKWECPGGKLDAGQDLHRAFEREVMEETGLLAEPINRMAYIDSYVIGGGKYTGASYVMIFSVGKLLGGNLALSHEHSEYQWLTYDEALLLDLTQEVRKAFIVLKDQIVNRTKNQ